MAYSAYSLRQLGGLLRGRQIGRCLLLTDQTASATSRQHAAESLSKAGIEYTSLEVRQSADEPGPALADADFAAAQARDYQASAVVALGGDDALHLSKAVAALASQGADARCMDYATTPDGCRMVCPTEMLFVAAVPTTATSAATGGRCLLWDGKCEQLVSLMVQGPWF